MNDIETGTGDDLGDPPRGTHLPHTADGGALVDDTALARLVRDLADAVIICDPDGAIQLWNAAATRVFGWTVDEAMGASLDLIIPERLRDRHWAGYRRVMETGLTSYGDRLLEVPARHRDGRTISIAFTVSLLRSSPNAAVTGIAAVIRDDTERWQERRRLRHEGHDRDRADHAPTGG